MVSLSPVFLPTAPPPLPPARRRGSSCQPNKAVVSNTHRKETLLPLPLSPAPSRQPSHIGSDGATLFFFFLEAGQVEGVRRGGSSPLPLPRGGIMGVNLPCAVLLQARRSTIISQSRWKGASAPLLPPPPFPSLPPPPPPLLCQSILLESGLIQRGRTGATAPAETMNDEILVKSDESRECSAV